MTTKLKENKKMICFNCKKEMKNVIDSKTKKISKYLWKCDCKATEGLTLSVG